MSKSIGKAATFGALGGLVNAGGKMTKVSYDGRPANDYVNYLSQYDTSAADNTLNNLTNYAQTSSNNLNNMGDYTFNVDGSDAARMRAENAIYSSMLDKLNPQFERQQADYSTMLQNKGIPVGSEAYERAMGDLQEKQNDALNQAAYASVMGGQNAYSQSLNDQINAGNFGNQAQASYIAQILAALGESPSAFDIQGDIYAVRSNKAANDYTAKQQTAANRLSLINSLLGAAGKAAGAAAGGAA